MLASAALLAALLAAQPPLFERGAEAFAAGEFAQAEKLLAQAVKQQPRSFEARFLLGATLVQLNRTEAAIEQLRAAHQLNPRHPDALKLLAAQYMTKRDFPSAIALLKPAVAAPAADEEMYLLLVEAALTAGDTEGSFALSQQAVKRALR
jgi:Flp pilus assembly protein TadD